jgi:hypothetical protein
VNYLNKGLEALYLDVKDWLKFAETKNVALITFNSACLFFLFNLLKQQTAYITLSIIYCIGIIISILIALFSYLPKFTRTNFIELIVLKFISNKDDNDNMLYYKDLIKYSQSELENTYLKVFDVEEFTNEYEKILIRQIRSISLLAYKKYAMFYLALSVILIQVFSLIILLIIA